MEEPLHRGKATVFFDIINKAVGSGVLAVAL
jgi:hypothetical protein